MQVKGWRRREGVLGLTYVTSDWVKISRRVTVSGTAFTDRWMGRGGGGGSKMRLWFFNLASCFF